MTKVIISVVGKDAVGITAKICTYLAKRNLNIMDITQTIRDGFFNMMMIVDADNCTISLGELSKEMDVLGEMMGVSIRCQHEEIFNKMHRI